MKTYICLACGEHGCKLEADDYGGNPMVCPYKCSKRQLEWKEIVKITSDNIDEIKDDLIIPENVQELKDFFEDNKKYHTRIR